MGSTRRLHISSLSCINFDAMKYLITMLAPKLRMLDFVFVPPIRNEVEAQTILNEIDFPNLKKLFLMFSYSSDDDATIALCRSKSLEFLKSIRLHFPTIETFQFGYVCSVGLDSDYDSDDSDVF